MFHHFYKRGWELSSSRDSLEGSKSFRWKTSSGHHLFETSTKRVQICSLRIDAALAPVGWYVSRRSPGRRIHVFDLTRCFKIQRAQFAVFLEQKIIRLAVAPCPAGLVDVSNDSSHLCTEFQKSPRRYSFFTGGDLVERSAANVLHDQMVRTVGDERIVDSRDCLYSRRYGF